MTEVIETTGAALSDTLAVAVVPLKVAVTGTEVATVTPPVTAVKLEVETPLSTVVVAGTWTNAGFELISGTTAPPVCAGMLRAIVPVVLKPPSTAFMLTVESFTTGVIVRAVTLLTAPSVTYSLSELGTVIPARRAVSGVVMLVCPCGIVTDAGQVAFRHEDRLVVTTVAPEQQPI